jgi:hypothetical protein
MNGLVSHQVNDKMFMFEAELLASHEPWIRDIPFVPLY